VYALKRPFTENETTWNRASGAVLWTTPGAKSDLDRDTIRVGTLSAPSTGKATVALNAAGLAAVQGWVDNPAVNYGLIIADEAAIDGIDFHCRETTTKANRPQLTISYAGTPQVDLVDWIWSGGVTTETAVVNARLKAADDNVRLLVSEDSDLSSPATFGPFAANSANDNTVSFALNGLSADRQYHYAIEAGGQVDDVQHGQFRTFAAGAHSFTFAMAGDAFEGSNMPVFDAVREENALFFLSPGDFMYADITVNDVDEYREAFGNTLRASRQSALYRSLPIAYTWDDHDYSSNNSNKNAVARPAARAAYREIVPHYPLDAGAGDAPIYQSFAVGRAYFIMTDLRSERDPAGNTLDASRTMMGAAQKQWFKDELLYAKANYPLIFWVSSVPWIADAANNRDDWGGYHAERVEIADFIKANQIRNLVVLSADAHMIAADDGYAEDGHSDYATGGGAPLRVLHAAALNQNGSLKGGPYNKGYFTNPSSSVGQYGLVQVRDNGSDSLSVRFIGKRLPAATLTSPMSASFVAATEILIDWQFELPVPTAVHLVDFHAAAAADPARFAPLFLLLPAGGLALAALTTRARRRLPH
jgi:alkaline phosphatase D